jgi:uncharacterized protein YkwD
MFGNTHPKVFGLALLLAAALFPSAAQADAGPVPCVSLLPTLTNCPQPQPSQPAASGVASAQTGQSSQSSGPTSVSAVPDLAHALLAEVNRTRRRYGLRTLRLSATLSLAGTAHAQALAKAGLFTHDWPSSGRLFSSWIRSFYPAHGYRAWSAGENLLWASPGFTTASAVQQWLDSPTHRRVMLTKSWRELGVGVVAAQGAPGAYGGRDVQIAAAEFGSRQR